MKKLFFLVSLVVLLGVSGSVWGQGNTGRTPEIGSTHNYSVTSNTGSSYAWTVTESVDGTGTNLIGSVVAGASTTSTISLTWNAPVSGKTYYVHVVETNNNCTNHKAYAVRPTTLELEIVALDATTNHVAQNIGTAAEYCAKDVAVTAWNGGDVSTEEKARDFTYDYGTTYLYYRIEAKNYDYATLTWKPTVSLTKTNLNGATVSITWSTNTPTGTGPQTGWTSVSDGSEFTVPTGKQYAYIEVAVNNNTNKTSGNEGTTQQTVQTDLTGKDNQDNRVSKINGNTATANDNAVNNIKPRPNTGVIDSD